MNWTLTQCATEPHLRTTALASIYKGSFMAVVMVIKMKTHVVQQCGSLLCF